MKVAVYSYLFGDYDQWIDPVIYNKDHDYFLYTDNPTIKSNVYEIIECPEHKDTARNGRRWKLYLGYYDLVVKGYDLIVSHDSNIRINSDLADIYKNQVTDFMLMKHPTRDCIYDEYHACCDGEKDGIYTMAEQVQGYADEFYPKHNGMVATGVMFRRNTKKVQDFCRIWFEEVLAGSIRDQLSFNYVAWKLKFKYDMIDFNYTLTWNFNYYQHKHRMR